MEGVLALLKKFIIYGITVLLLRKRLILRYALHNIIVAQKWLKYDLYCSKTG